MIITLADWEFEVDYDATWEYTFKCSLDHCTCPYCENFYENLDISSPELRPVLRRFGVYANGPCEVMPFEPTLVAAAYRITGKITSRGQTQLHVEGVPLRPEYAAENSFLLWIGPMEIPWTRNEDMYEVLSPANQPDFMDRMMARLLKWVEEDNISS